MPSQRAFPLILGENISLHPEALTHADDASPRVLVVGGGVTGLITTWTLLDRGYHVTVVSKEWASWGKTQRLTSQIAGALWEFPPAVCGQHTDPISLNNSKRWCMVSYQIWDAIANDPELSAASGIKMKPANFYFPCAVEDDPAQYLKMKEIQQSGVRGFYRDRHLRRGPPVSRAYGVADAYEHLAPIIDTDRAMGWLMELVQSKGAQLVTEEIDGDLFDRELELLERFNADIIVNATGLAGATIAGDKSCYPIRGALLRVINDGSDFPKINNAMTISADAAHDSNEIVFIVPRNDNILLIGGIAEPHQWKLDHTLDSPIVKRMRKRCEAFLPQLRNARLDPEYPLAQGLRPFRGANVRVERELRLRGTWNGDMTKPTSSRIVHTYGQGGAGWSLAFGCASDAADLVGEALQNMPAVPMAILEEYGPDVQEAFKARL